MLQLRPLGDQAVVAYLDSETAAQAFARAVRDANDPWLVDVVAAYSSVAVFYDLARTDYRRVSERLSGILGNLAADPADQGDLHQIPCCYEMGPDLERVAQERRLSVAEVIRLHSGTVYTVYAIGFCPGFPYLGYLPVELTGVPRLPTPRLRVEPGSVGLTGRQTGIYPESRPGGWNIVGRTPLELVKVRDGYFPLRTGDRVRFEPIGERDFGRLSGNRL